MNVRLTALVVAGALLGGCASPAPDYSASAAVALQQRVLAVTEAAATGDALTALLRLQELEAAAYDAAARSWITEARLASILSSIALVRADLEKALSQAELAELQKRLDELERQQPAEQPAEQQEQSGSGSSGGEQRGEAEKEAAKNTEEERKKAEDKAREAREEAREAQEKARKAREEAQKRAEEEEKKQRGKAGNDD